MSAAGSSVRTGRATLRSSAPRDDVGCPVGQLVGELGEVLEELRGVGVVGRLHVEHALAVDDRAVDRLAQAVAGRGQLVEHDVRRPRGRWPARIG